MGKKYAQKFSKSLVFSPKEWTYLKKCYHLTPRELDVAKFVCQGYDNEQIARDLSIAYNTARAHLGNIYRRVGVKNKIQLFLQFIKVVNAKRH